MHENFSRSHALTLPSDRSFGFVMSAAFAVLTGVSWWRTGTVRGWILGVSVAFVVVALARPAVLRPLNRLWTAFGRLLHRIVTPIMLAAMFFGILTPTARIARLFGHVWLPLAREPEATTYWCPRPSTPSAMTHQY